MQPFPLASADDVVAVNGTPHSDDVEEMGAKLSVSIQDEYNCDELVQSLHDAAKTFELALLKKISSSKLPWFSSAWLGVDRNAWVKTFSYQVCTRFSSTSVLQYLVCCHPPWYHDRAVCNWI